MNFRKEKELVDEQKVAEQERRLFMKSQLLGEKTKEQEQWMKNKYKVCILSLILYQVLSLSGETCS